KHETIDESINLTLWVLSRATTEKETILSAFNNAYERAGSMAPRAAIVDKAADLGAASAGFLERVLLGDDGAIVRAGAARRLLEFLPEAEVKGRLATHFSTLLVPVVPLTADDF